MTEVEAIRVFDGLRKEYRAMKPGDDRRALQALLTARVVPGGLGHPRSGLRTLLAS